jgi:arylsulfatase
LPGRSLVPACGKDIAIQRDFLYFRHEANRALRVGDWKIVASGADAPWELYDLAKDRSECHDLAGKHPDKVKELAAMWTRHDEEFRKQGASAPAKGPDR